MSIELMILNTIIFAALGIAFYRSADSALAFRASICSGLAGGLFAILLGLQHPNFWLGLSYAVGFFFIGMANDLLK